ncbi:unnamed protein product [Phyllotreta striolata]|uniref:Major facilitator superfamily (MFS) profile domain-containing protein n=1 Tax=Phyllotreta striolata TaxID=444603 RepID=A0A9P0DXE6_PHYSR|nr:unnamed protein product [Phyllotreta striolata]
MILYVGRFSTLLGTTLAGCLLSTTVGNLNSWTSPVLPKLENLTSDNPFDHTITSSQASWLSSLLTLGAILGCWFFGALSDIAGKRPVFISLGLPLLLGYILMASVGKIEAFYVARFAQGTAMGGLFALMNYLGEVSSKENRGVVMTLTGMMVSAGALFSYVVGPFVSVNEFNAIMAVVPAVFLVVSYAFCAESPYFYLMKNEVELAKKSLRAFRGDGCDIDGEIDDMKVQIKAQNEGSIIDIVKTRGFLKAFTISIVLVTSQQFTGINAILMYSQPILDLTNSGLSPEIGSMIIGAIQLLSGGITPLIIGKFGRKSIMLASGLGMILSESILGIYCIFQRSGADVDSINFLPLLTLAMFMLSYNFGFGPLCWMIPSEILPTRVKILATSFIVSVYFVVGFFIAQFFNPIVDAVGIGAVFVFFAVCCAVTCVFIKFYVIETVGKSLEEIQNYLNGAKGF